MAKDKELFILIAIVAIVAVIGMIVLILGAKANAPKSIGQAGDLVGEASKYSYSNVKGYYTVQCKDVKGIVLALPKDSGYVGGRGILSYEPNNLFALSELQKIRYKEEAYKINNLESFPLTLCKSKVVDWPIDDCDTCTTPATLRLVGFHDNKNIALVEFHIE